MNGLIFGCFNDIYSGADNLRLLLIAVFMYRSD